MQEIYLAGGCFWGLQRAMDRIVGVVDTEAGYANGSGAAPTYEDVRANSGHTETVRVVFDKGVVSLEELLDSYLSYLASTGVSWQATGLGYGSQYRYAIFCVDEAQLAEVRTALDREQAGGGDVAGVQVELLRNYGPAEDRHQARAKGPVPTCRRDDCARCERPKDELKQRIGELAYDVTQKGATERAFTGQYDDFFEPGIYVDVVSASTGEMRKRYGFIYVDKYDDGTGDLSRSRKDSFFWYQKCIKSNGEDLD